MVSQEFWVFGFRAEELGPSGTQGWNGHRARDSE